MKKKINIKDKKILSILKKEKKFQKNCINLIASENYASNSILLAQGSCLTNKYAEGYPGKRYYSGCKYIDKIEKIAIKRAKKLFCVDYANVQPHSGSQANFSVYQALLKPKDKILGMKLSDGGHLTHGSLVNFSGIFYKTFFYGLNEREKIDYNRLRLLAHKYLPNVIIAGFSSYSGVLNWKKFRKIADEINAYLIADISHVAGLIVTNLYPSPVKYAHVITSTTHKTLAGPRGGIILSNCKDNDLYKKINSSVFPGTQGGPLMHVIAAKAISFKQAMKKKFFNYQRQILKNASLMVKYLKKNNFDIISNETKNHLFLINLKKNKITGLQAEKILEKSNILTNKNSIPNDCNNAFITSGLRIGTAAITKRGFKKFEIKKISFWITKLLTKYKNNLKYQKKIKKKVIKLCKNFPIYK